MPPTDRSTGGVKIDGRAITAGCASALGEVSLAVAYIIGIDNRSEGWFFVVLLAAAGVVVGFLMPRNMQLRALVAGMALGSAGVLLLLSMGIGLVSAAGYGWWSGIGVLTLASVLSIGSAALLAAFSALGWMLSHR